MFKFKFEAMGTVLEIQIFDSVNKILEEKIKSEVFDFTVFYDDSLSRFKDNSLVSKISRKTGVYEVPKELVKLLEIYKKFFILTKGAMNPLVGNTLSDLGYDAKYSLTKKEKICATPDLLDTIEIKQDEKINKYIIETKEKVLIDIGSIGKGYWVDKVKKILEKNRINHFLINGSGDIYYSSPYQARGVKIGLENSDGNIFKSTEILNEAICGSGTHKRNWSVKEGENLHHIINAKTGLPTDNIESVWIKVRSDKFPTTYADALTTAIFFIDPEILQNIVKVELDISFEYYIIYTNKKTLFSKNFF